MQFMVRIILCSALLVPLESMAQHVVEADAGAPRHLDTIVVSGALPAPGLWELTRGTKRVLIMGTLTPAPTRMQWHSPSVEARVAEAQVVLESPAVSVSADIGLLRGMLLWPAYQRSKRNPDGKSLQDVLAPETHARWRMARSRYMGNDRKVETLRPIHAAKALFDAAVRKAGLTDEERVDPVIRRIARTHGIPVQSTALRIVIADPKQTLDKLRSKSLDDTQCLEQTLDRLEVDLQTMAVRANAWAEGDMTRLRALPYIDQKVACVGAWSGSEIARAQGISDIDRDMRERWLDTLRTQLKDHDVVFATMPIGRLEGEGGILAALRADGFSVKAPE